MRLPLLVAAAATALTAPAHAAVYPVCEVHIAATTTTDTCTTGNSPQVRSFRTFTVSVAEGTVDATLRCTNYPYADTTVTRTFSGADPKGITVQDYGKACYATITAVGASATATGVSYVVPDLFQ